MGTAGTDLAARLTNLGYEVAELDLSEFLRGGGSAKARALRLSDTTVTNALPINM